MTDVAGRLRAANPRLGGAAVAPPPATLARITATARDLATPRRRSTLRRRPLLAALVALLVACGIALAADISVRYFESGSTAPPAAVTKALADAANHLYPHDEVALRNTVTAYVFASATGSGTVYMAPYVHQQGFCAALAVTAKPVQAGCTLGGSVTSVSGDGLQPWDFALTPDVHALLGRLSAAAAGDEVEIGFEDGSREPAPMHGRWFAYAAAGTRAQAGHRPDRLTVLDGDRVIRSEALLPTTFNTLAVARALVPTGNGSPGQAAVRRYLLAGLDSRSGDGGYLASHTDIAQTRRVASLALAGGVRIVVYAAPVRRYHGVDAMILLGLDTRYRDPLLSSFNVTGRRTSAFQGAGSCACVPHGSSSSFSFLYGTVPLRVSAVAVRTADGAEHPARLFEHGSQWVWIGLAQKPRALVGRDASGAVVTTLRLREPH